MTSWPRTTRGPAPRPVVAAGALGIAGSLPLTLVLLAFVLMTGDDGSVDAWSWALLLVPAGQLTGAVLLLRRRSWLVLALGCLPGVLLLAGALAGSGFAVLDTPGLTALLLLPAVTLGLTLQRGVRDWVRGRTPP